MISDKPVVLFVNHREKSCGVHQFGERLFFPALKSEKFSCHYIDPAEGSEFDHWVGQLNPNIIVYNYYSAATMPWLSSQKVLSQKNRFKQIGIFHELPLDNMNFDVIIHQDPSNTDTRFINIARPIPDYRPESFDSATPVFGSFGFGLGGKGFTRVVEYVLKEYDNAIIRFNIPFAAFGDPSGAGARDWAAKISSMVSGKRGIYTIITHELMEERTLLDWLASNTINCFLYDENYGRGISGTLDYALAAGKPIAITKSWQFKHFWEINEQCLIEKQSLHEIIAQGTQHLQVYHNIWGNKAVLHDFEAIFSNILAKD